MVRMKLSAVIFDYGGVISTPQDRSRQQSMCDAAGLRREVFEELYYRFRVDYDRGFIDGDEYWQRILCSGGVQASDQLVKYLIQEDILSWMGVDQRVLRWAWRIADQGLMIGILSNMPRDELEYFRSEFEWFDRFNVTVFSCEIGSAKPELQMYERLLREVKVPPDEVLFLDDRRENIDAARHAGLHAQLFSSFEEMEEDWSWPAPGPL
jgi:putative hydrolase of the HAD superfamily